MSKLFSNDESELDFVSNVKLNETELESSENDEFQKFQSLLNTLRGSEDFVLDNDGKIISSNLEAITISGYEEWEVIGNHISVFYTKDDIELNKPQEDLSKAVKFGKYISTGFTVKKKGTIFWAKMKFTKLNFKRGDIARFRVELLDTTHRAMYTVSTKRIKDEYLSLFNNSFIGIFKFSMKDFSCINLNEKAMNIIGMSSSKLYLENLFFDKEDYSKLINLIRLEKRVENFEFRLNRSDNEMYCSLSCKSYLIGGFIEGVLVDTTEKRISNSELKKLNSELDNFLYHASHDIRSPLASILGLVNLIKAEYFQADLIKYVDKIYDRISHLDNILKDLSLVAFNNSQSVNIEVVDLEDIIKMILADQGVLYPKTKFYCTNNSPQKNICTDNARVNRVLHNIILNAFKYSSAKEMPCVSIFFSIDDCNAHIEIRDNGIGINHEYLNTIFEVFFKMDSGGTGSGLGLYIVRIILEKLGGTIELESEVNIGTVVRLNIPNEQQKYSMLYRKNSLL